MDKGVPDAVYPRGGCGEAFPQALWHTKKMAEITYDRSRSNIWLRSVDERQRWDSTELDRQMFFFPVLDCNVSDLSPASFEAFLPPGRPSRLQYQRNPFELTISCRGSRGIIGLDAATAFLREVCKVVLTPRGKAGEKLSTVSSRARRAEPCRWASRPMWVNEVKKTADKARHPI